MGKKEFQIGEEFQFGHKRLRCERDIEKCLCKGCVFRGVSCGGFIADCVGECSKSMRTDKTDVIFVEVK